MRALLFSVATTSFCAAAAAQHTSGYAASSPTWFLSAAEFGSAEDADTLLYRLRSTQGAGVVVEPDAASPTYRMRGGFTGALSAPVLGQPWLTGVRPFWIKPNGNSDLTVHGSELWLGPTPTVTIGGVPAGVVARTVDQMVITPPPLTVPGFQPVVTTNSAGSSVLPEGVGVLPMLEQREPLNGADPNHLRIHALPFDIVLLVLAGSQAPGIQVLDFQYVLLLHPSTVFFTDAFLVTGADGKTTIPLPPFPTGLVHVQALVITADPSYYPGMWTNPLAL
jgi:hypothetical protein